MLCRDHHSTFCGTPNFLAPEILDSNDSYSEQVDIWSLGCMLHCLLLGKPPFEGKKVRYKLNYIVVSKIQLNNPVAKHFEISLVWDTLRLLYRKSFPLERLIWFAVYCIRSAIWPYILYNRCWLETNRLHRSGPQHEKYCVMHGWSRSMKKKWKSP